MFKCKFIDEMFDIAKLQVSKLKQENRKSYYEDLCKLEYNIIKDYIHYPKKVLDLGCGLGRMSIYLNHKIKNDQTKYILADFDKVNKNLRYFWNPENDYYNKLNLTKEFCNLNNLYNIELFDLEIRNLNELTNIELVISFLAVGFHYPIESYIDNLMSITSDDCVLIFGVRDGKYKRGNFRKYFKSRLILSQRIVQTKEQILIMKNKKR